MFQDDQEQFQILLSQTEQEGVHICQSKHHHGTADNKRHFTLILFPLYGYVVLNFLSQVIFVFLLFFGMVMYANEIETKEK